jgi:hypothetical protein
MTTKNKHNMTGSKISLTKQRMKQLDQVLKYYIDTKTSEHSFLQFASFGHDVNNLDSIEEELRGQKYIMKIGTDKLNTITEKGTIFWDNGNGGYLKPYKKHKMKERWDKIHKWGLYVAAIISVSVTLYTTNQKKDMQDKLIEQEKILDTLQKQVYRLNLHIPKVPLKNK